MNLSDRLRFVPPLEQEELDQAEIDRLVALGQELRAGERPPYHIDVLYGRAAAGQWDRPQEGD